MAVNRFRPARSRIPPLVEPLERRQLLATLPFHLDFNASAGGILDGDDQGTGFESVQPNTNGTEYQQSLIDLDTAAGVLSFTTNGTSTSGGNSRDDNTLANALQIAFDGTQTFEVRTKIVGGLSAISEGYEQAGVFFGPDQDNWIKLVAIWHVGDGGPRLEFADEYSDGAGGTTSTVNNGRVFVANWSSVSTLDLRLVCNPVTGLVTAHYKLDGAASWSQVPHSITVPTDKRSAFFGTSAKAGFIQFDKSQDQNLTVSYDFFTVERQSPAVGPSVRSMIPAPGSSNVLRDAFVAVDLNLPNGSLDPTTVTGDNVYLTNNATGQTVAANVNTTGGGDAITLTPLGLLAANTVYTFHITSGVEDAAGANFQPFTASFTTGDSVAESDPRIAFNRTIQSASVGIGWTGAAIGPDGRFYGVTHEGQLHRFDIGADGSLTNRVLLFSFETAAGSKRLITGIAFDTSQATLTAYVSHGQWVDPGNDQDRTAADWTGSITRFTGANLSSRQDVIVGLPRSVYDHLNNQPVFGPDGKLYFVVASNTAMGAPDSTWANRPERLLSGAVLQADVRNITSTLNVKTQDGGTYDPFAAGAPVKIYATGIRNGWDLVWTNGGHLFVPANGSAAGGNTPAGPGNNPPAINGVTQTQNDFLFRIVQGGYYGHPNPLRGEYVLNGGNPTSGIDPAEVTQYPVGTMPPAHYRGFAYDFGRNVSPNGIVQYNSSGAHFGGALDGKLLVVRYSGGDDILIIDVAADGTVTRAYGGAFGMTGMTDPLDIIQHPTTGNLYVVEAGFRTDGGNPNGLRISLLKPIAQTNVTVGSPRLLNYAAGPALHFSDVFGNSQPGLAHRITITNSGSSVLALPADAFSITGSAAARFSLGGVPALPASLAPGQSLNLDVFFTANMKGVVSATLTIKTNDLAQPTRTIALRGLGTVGEGGSNEPSLQRILDLYQLPITVADPDPETTDYPSQTVVAGSDEIATQLLRMAGSGPVRIELLASMGTANANAFTDTSVLGWYSPASAGRVDLLRIAKTYAQTANVTHTGGLSFAPTGDFGLVGTFFDFGPRHVWSEDARNTWESTAGERRKVRFYPLKNSSGAVVPNAYVFAFEEFPNATDQNDIVGIIYNVQPANVGSRARVTNSNSVPFHDRLLFHRIRHTDLNFPNAVKDTASLLITNTGTQDLTISSISVSNGEFSIIGGGIGGTPVTLAPGATRTVTIQFVYNNAAADGTLIRTANLTIASNDAFQPSHVLELRGLWQSHSEDGRLTADGQQGISQEPNLYEMAQSLGYMIDVGPNTGRDFNSGTNTGGRVEPIGSETISAYWRRVDSGLPVDIFQIAAWHKQLPDTNTNTRWYVQGSPGTPSFLYRHEAAYGQSIFPPLQGSTQLARATFNPGSSAFGMKFDYVFSDPRLNPSFDPGHGMRWYALHNRQGNRIPDAWLIAQDYVGQSGVSNYDYQDNIYVIFNVKPVTGPTAPRNQSASGTASGNVLTWTRNAEGNLAGYSIYRADSAGGPFTKINTALVSGPGSTLTFTDASAPVGVTQHYRIVTMDEHGTEGAFAAASATRPSGSGVPATPSGLAASTVEHNRVVIGWSDNSNNETGFRIERALGNGAFSSLGTVGAGIATFTDSTAQPLTTYRYRVFAFNAQGDSTSSSNTITITTPAAPIAAPTNLAASAPLATQVNLTWMDNASNETGFVVERRLAASSTWQQIATLAQNSQSHIDTTVSPNTAYVYRVFAQNAQTQSTYSNTASITTPQSDAFVSDNIGDATGSTTVITPGVDFNVSATGSGTGGTSDNVRFVHRLIIGDFDYLVRVDSLTQASSSSAAGLMVRESTAAGGRNIFVRNSGQLQLSYRDLPGGSTNSTGLGNVGVPVWLRLVRAGDVFTAYWSLTGSGWTQLAQVTVPMDVALQLGLAVASYSPGTTTANFRSLGIAQELAPAAPTNLAAAPSSQNVLLTWTDNADNEAGYRVERRSSGTTTWQTLVQLPANATQHTDSNVTAGASYEYRVLAVNGAGESTSAIVSATIPGGQAPPSSVVGGASADGEGGASLFWISGGGPVTIYRVERRVSPAGQAPGAWRTVATLAGSATGLRDASATAGSTWQYRVFATGSAGESGPSTVVTVHIPRLALPGLGMAPLAVIGETLSDTVVRLSWIEIAEGEVGYRVQRRIGGGQWIDHALLPAESSAFIDSNLAGGRDYEYRVRVEGGGLLGAWSAAVRVAMPSPALWQHTGVGGINAGVTEVRPSAHYDASANGRDIGGTADEFGFIYRHVTGDFDYAVRVTRLDGSDPGRMAGLMARSSLDAEGPNAYVKLLESEVQLTSRGTTGGQTATRAVLGTNTGARWVRLRRTGDVFTTFVATEGRIWTEVGRVTLAVGSQALLGLATSAHSPDGLVNVRYRDLTDLRSASLLPLPPTSLSGQFQGGLVSLSWTDTSGGLVGFSVQRREGGGLWQTLGFVGEGATGYTDATVQTNRSYEYRVAGETSSGIGPHSSAVGVQT